MYKYPKIIALTLLLAMVGCATSNTDLAKKRGDENVNSHKIVEEDFEPEVYRVIFTTLMSMDNRPLKEVKEISIQEESIYMFSAWRLSNRQHDIKIFMYDGDGNKIHSTGMKTYPSNNSFNVTGKHKIMQGIDVPGLWKFQVYVDGILRLERYLEVYDKYGRPDR